MADEPVELTLRIYRSDGLKSRTRTFRQPVIRIGKVAEYVDLHIEDDPKVSQVHALLTVSPEGEIQLTDLGTLYGTYVQGERIGRATLRRGDDLLLAETRLTLESGAEPSDAPRHVEPPSRWRRLLQIVGWYWDKALGVVGLTFFAFLAATGIGLLGAALYGSYFWARASPVSFVVSVGVVALVGFVIYALLRRCFKCRRWFALRVVDSTFETRSGTASVRTYSGGMATVVTREAVEVVHLQCRYCGKRTVRRW